MFNTLNSILNFLDQLKWHSVLVFSTLFMRLVLWLKGIPLGVGSRFIGRAIVKRSRESRILIGKNCVFRSSTASNLIGLNRPCFISSIGRGSKIEIGSNCGFSGTVIGCFNSITIGDRVRCGANSLITDGDWHPDDERSGLSAPIIIGDDVWLGVNVTVLKGVVIGRNTVVGAGSVVVKSLPENVIAAGNPCKVVKHLSE